MIGKHTVSPLELCVALGVLPFNILVDEEEPLRPRKQNEANNSAKQNQTLQNKEGSMKEFTFESKGEFIRFDSTVLSWTDIIKVRASCFSEAEGMRDSWHIKKFGHKATNWILVKEEPTEEDTKIVFWICQNRT